MREHVSITESCKTINPASHNFYSECWQAHPLANRLFLHLHLESFTLLTYFRSAKTALYQNRPPSLTLRISHVWSSLQWSILNVSKSILSFTANSFSLLICFGNLSTLFYFWCSCTIFSNHSPSFQVICHFIPSLNG